MAVALTCLESPTENAGIIGEWNGTGIALGDGMVPQVASDPLLAYDTARLFHDYSGKVFRWARRLVHSSSDAEDIVQEVFLILHRRQLSADCVHSPGAWLLKVTFNLARHVWRKRGYSVQELHSEASSAPGPLEQLESHRAIEQLEAAVGSLDESYQEIFWLCEIQGLSSARVAALLGVHPATLRVRRFRARAQIARCLALGSAQ